MGFQQHRCLGLKPELFMIQDDQCASMEAGPSLEVTCPSHRTERVTSSLKDVFGISTFFLTACLCFFTLSVLFYVISWGALPEIFPRCLDKKSKGTDDVIVHQNPFSLFTIALVSRNIQYHMPTFYHHIWSTELLKRESTSHREEALWYYFHEYLKSQVLFCPRVSFYSCAVFLDPIYLHPRPCCHNKSVLIN